MSEKMTEGIRATDKYDNMNENELRNAARSIEERLKQSVDKYESERKKFEEAQSELVATKEENRELNKSIQNLKLLIQNLEFENNNLKQQLLDIRSFEAEMATTRIINDRMMFENDRLDRYVMHLIDSYSKQLYRPMTEGK